MALRPHCYPHAPVGLCPPCSDHAYNAPKLVQEWVIVTRAISCTDCSLDLEKCVDIKSFRRSPFMRRSSRLMLLTTLLAAVAGCSSQNHPNAALQAPVVYQTASTPSPSWVFGPSAPLPAGFPKPGPVGEIIIKQYPASRIAIVDRDQRHQGSGGLFMPLFRHIEKKSYCHEFARCHDLSGFRAGPGGNGFHGICVSIRSHRTITDRWFGKS